MDGGAEPLTSAGRECDVTSFFSTLPGTSASADSAAAKPREPSLLNPAPLKVKQTAFIPSATGENDHCCRLTYQFIKIHMYP